MILKKVVSLDKQVALYSVVLDLNMLLTFLPLSFCSGLRHHPGDLDWPERNREVKIVYFERC